MKKSTLLKKD